ncbi:carboxypeptidase regulatory-like domain-containing protein [Aggregicoccus sp. 17bor-14]|uniref:carboxypeptidase-like regulatory domain-containing protein n=1 Tax=Myxococcaceae TaxID=31 RepID=UPI00129C4E12|nr:MULTISPECIES: carboxypeptidase-like regulatory domain-containing protein [Myxococcaceae]MBF5043250.1 carboxypeptidase regulatory-like domain-containing protein [Simulacricoccus sp. 17bor-14]MRI89007.1 carboxypeptidase regulatory-like domain-containing protein [Aggregicoccus sp. 17bor-14]
MKRLLSLLLCATTLLAACGGGDAPEEAPAPVAGGAVNPGGSSGPQAPSTLAVRGTVLSAARQPVAGLAVLIVGQTPVNTDAAGRFSFSGVVPPYDLTVVDAANKEAAVYRQLRRADPTLVLFTPDGTPRAAQLQGRVTGGHSPQDSDEFTALAFLAPGTFAQNAADGAGGYRMGVQWYGPSTVDGMLYALQLHYNASTGLPSGYSGYAAQPLTLADGAISIVPDLGLLPITSGTVSGAVSVPAGYALDGKGVGITLDGAAGYYFPDRSTSPGFSYLLPYIPGGQALLRAHISKAGGGATEYLKAGVSVGAAQVSLAPQAPPESILPADGATRVDGQMRFSWTTFERGIHLAIFEPESADAPRITVVTAETSTSLPDLAALGLALPPSTRYTWHVEAVGPLAGVDAAASTALLDLQTFARGTPEAQLASSAVRTFVTAP